MPVYSYKGKDYTWGRFKATKFDFWICDRCGAMGGAGDKPHDHDCKGRPVQWEPILKAVVRNEKVLTPEVAGKAFDLCCDLQEAGFRGPDYMKLGDGLALFRWDVAKSLRSVFAKIADGESEYWGQEFIRGSLLADKPEGWMRLNVVLRDGAFPTKEMR